MAQSIVLENMVRAGLPGYGSVSTGGTPDALRAILTSQGANELNARKYQDSIDMQKQRLAAELKQIDAQIASEAERLGIAKETLAASIDQFNKNYQLNLEEFGFEKEQANKNTALQLMNAGYGTAAEKKATVAPYGFTALPDTLTASQVTGASGGSTGTSAIQLNPNRNFYVPNNIPSLTGAFPFQGYYNRAQYYARGY